MHRLLLLLALLCFAPATARDFDPRSLRGQHAGPPTQMLTIANTHLYALQPPPAPALLARVIDKLAAWKPDIITHEAISGAQCDYLARHGARYPGTFALYCHDAALAAQASGLDVAAALAAVETTLADWPATPSASQRRRLALLFLAANERHSARVQWQQLAAADRFAADGLTPALLPILDRAGGTPNESDDIAVALAVRLGHQRVHPVDDHSADSVLIPRLAAIDAALARQWQGPMHPAIAAYEKAAAGIATPEAMLAFYRLMNAPRTLRAIAEQTEGRAMADPVPPYFGRIQLAWWETRNLRMVAKVRAAAGQRPGARVLNLVGASHKPWYDAYLAMLSDVAVVDASSVLK